MRLKVREVVLIIAVILIGLGFIIYKNATKPPKLISDEAISLEVDATQFYKDFLENPTDYNEKFINKAIRITGKVTSFQDSIIVLNNKIVCMINKIPSDLEAEKFIKIKGRYIGYDDLFDNLKLNECILESF